MIYGKSKARDMGRSLLPSTRAKGARDDKAAVKRTVRHNIRQELHRVALDPEYYDDASTDFEAYPDREISEVVWERRQGDKTGPFERWSEAVTKDIDQDSRLSHVKGVLPKGIIGDHALTHIEWKKHFRSRAKLELEENIRLNEKEGRIRNRYNRKVKPEKRLSREEQLKTLRLIVEDGKLHRDLNDYISKHASFLPPTMSESYRIFNEELQKWETKYKTVYLTYPAGTTKKVGLRKLLGMHDIETFLDDVKKSAGQGERIWVKGKWYANPNYCGHAYQALQTFLRSVFEHKQVPKKLNGVYYW